MIDNNTEYELINFGSLSDIIGGADRYFPRGSLGERLEMDATCIQAHYEHRGPGSALTCAVSSFASHLGELGAIAWKTIRNPFRPTIVVEISPEAR